MIYPSVSIRCGRNSHVGDKKLTVWEIQGIVPPVIGPIVRAARKKRDMSLADTVDALKEALVDVSVSQLQRMEDDSRPGDPRVWGGLWKLFRLPPDDLYRALGLPVQPAKLNPTLSAIIAAVEPLPEATQEVVLGLARSLPPILSNAGLRHLPVGDSGHNADTAEAPRKKSAPYAGAYKRAEEEGRVGPVSRSPRKVRG